MPDIISFEEFLSLTTQPVVSKNHDWENPIFLTRYSTREHQFSKGGSSRIVLDTDVEG